MKKNKVSKIISVNLLLFFCISFIAELAFGNWIENFFRKENYIQIPGLIKSSVLKYDGRSIYYSNAPESIKYSRDELGYRSRSLPPQKPIILTIGGSTTDQVYVTDGQTWQDVLDLALPKYDFVNGGVDGQSSYGHLVSVCRAHSPL